MTIRKQLLDAGMREDQISSWQSDLHVLKNPISMKWLESYEHKAHVKTFKSNFDGLKWYDIPFGCMDEHIASKSN